MPITVRPFQLLQWKHAIRLETKGIKVARKSVRTHAAKHFGMKPRAPHEKVLEVIEAILEATKEAGVPATASVKVDLDDFGFN